MSCNCNSNENQPNPMDVEVRFVPKELDSRRFLSSFAHHGFLGNSEILAAMLKVTSDRMVDTMEEEKDRTDEYDPAAHYSACLGAVLGEAFDAAANAVASIILSGKG